MTSNLVTELARVDPHDTDTVIKALNAASAEIAHLRDVIAGYVNAKLAGRGSTAAYWWELQEIARGGDAPETATDWRHRAEEAERILSDNMALANRTTRRAMDERNAIIRKLRERYSAIEIADMVGLTRQRVHQILNEAPVEGSVHGSSDETPEKPVQETASPIAQFILDRVTEVNVGIFLTGAIDHIESGGNFASGEVELRNGTLVELRMSRLPVKTSDPPAECNEGLGQSRGCTSNAGLGSSAPRHMTREESDAMERAFQKSVTDVSDDVPATPDLHLVKCQRCEAEMRLPYTSESRTSVSLSNADGWYFSTDTGWLCPKDAPEQDPRK